MPITLYQITIPVFVRHLGILSQILTKASQHASTSGTSEADLCSASLVADMKPLTFQIQRVSDTVKFVGVRAAGIENVPMEDNETTFEDLQARIRKTIDYIKKVKPQDMEGKEDAGLTIKVGGKEWKLTNLEYIEKMAMPNFYFHITTAYDILRAKGVPVGKMDFLGQLDA